MHTLTAKETQITNDFVATVGTKLRTALSNDYESSSDLLETRKVLASLPLGTRIIIKPRGQILTIEGRSKGGFRIIERGGLNEIWHRFSGTYFERAADGSLRLATGHDPADPWCRLAFSPEGKPNFYLGVIMPWQSSNQAAFC